MGGGGGSGPRKVTTEFDYLTRDFRLPRQEKVEWKGADGVTIEELLYYPLEYQEGKRTGHRLRASPKCRCSSGTLFGSSLETGAIICVLYLPQNPRLNQLYPVSCYRVAQ
jgi:hypothetical protein